MDDTIKTGVGNPLSPYTNELLSEEDEKRVDDKGQLVTRGNLWSASGTGTFIWTALWVGQEITQLVPGGRGQTDIDLGNLWRSWNLSIGLSEGRPRFNRPTGGAALEVPYDLAEDDIKRQYVAEWLSETGAESFQERDLVVPKDKMKDLAMAVSVSANRAIGTLL